MFGVRHRARDGGKTTLATLRCRLARLLVELVTRSVHQKFRPQQSYNPYLFFSRICLLPPVKSGKPSSKLAAHEATVVCQPTDRRSRQYFSTAATKTTNVVVPSVCVSVSFVGGDGSPPPRSSNGTFSPLTHSKNVGKVCKMVSQGFSHTYTFS